MKLCNTKFGTSIFINNFDYKNIFVNLQKLDINGMNIKNKLILPNLIELE